MTIKFNVPGAKRKEMAQAIARWLGSDVHYLGAPSFAYELDGLSIDRDGNVVFDTLTDDAVIDRLFGYLYEEGFESDISASTDVEENTPEAITGISVQIPMEGFNEVALNNLYNLVEAKGNLIRKAVNADALPILDIDGRLDFAWFRKESTPEEIHAYMQLVTALCDMAKSQKRINAKEKTYENEKYAFRCFLLRLNFIGDEYKASRKILMKNFTGSSAFKTQKCDEEVA